SELLTLALSNPSARLQLAARKRLGRLLDNGTLTIHQLTTEVPRQLDLITLASYSQQANLEVLQAITDPALLLQLASDGNTTQLRKAAAARIETRTELEQLCKIAQGKDKTVYKLAKAKLDVFKAGDAQTAEARAAIAVLCGKLEMLSRLDADPMFKATIVLLENEWSLLADNATTELDARYRKALGACQQQVSVRAEHIAQAEEKIALDQQAVAFLDTAISEALNLVAQIYGLNEISTDEVAGYHQQLNDLTQAVRLAANRDLPARAPQEEFERVRDHAEFLLAGFGANGTLVQLTQAIATADAESGAQIKRTIRQYTDAARTIYRDQLPESVQAATRAVQAWSA